MSGNANEVGKAIGRFADNINTRNVIPFTGGIAFVAYAFFWPEGYGHWLGSIVHAFRLAAGI